MAFLTDILRVDFLKNFFFNSIFYLLIYSFLVIFFSSILITIYYHRKFNYPIILIKYVNGGINEIQKGIIGGYSKNSVGGKDFYIMNKYLFWTKKKIFLNDIDETKTDNQGNIYLLKISEDTYQQVYVKIDDEKKSLLIEPLQNEIITSVKNYLLMASSMFDKNRLSAWAIVFIAFIIMVIAHLTFLFIVRK